MEFTIYCASSWEKSMKLEIKSLEDLKNVTNKFVEKFGESALNPTDNEPELIVDFSDMTITIYDDDIE